MKSPVKALALTKEAFWENPKDGSFCMAEDPHHFLCVCPCGCGSMMNLPIYKSGTPKPQAACAWEWNGNAETPTLTPSIRDLSGCRFHGFLTGGVWTFCEDSGR